jgi:NADH-quinone oxidoreductase subunit L
MFLAFMLILITGNNLLMMFVGWEGVGVCSYLLIGFWWDKSKGEGIKNANAARKAFIANRVGDFGVLMAIFLCFWTFGTLDFFKATEVVNPSHVAHLAEGGHGEEHGSETEEHGAEEGGEHGGEAEGESLAAQTVALASDTTIEEGETTGGGEGDGHGAATEGDAHGEGEAHAAEGEAHSGPTYLDNSHLTFSQLGMFGQAEKLMKLKDGETLDRGDGTQVGRTFTVGGVTMDIGTIVSLIALFMLLGAAGKSAQIPLFVWLPDAMAGPTPVSALIHAATMVTAGVYMMVRSNTFFYFSPEVSLFVTIIGGVTALLAGFMALGQWDIKRVLAYSTVSQLGFMVAAVGIGAYAAAMFHMITHAFFKALLFLGSGSVIHGMEHGHHHLHDHGHAKGGHGHDDKHGAHDSHGHDAHAHKADAHGHDDKHDDHGHDDHFDPQDMRTMGGLWRRMPITFVTYVIGAAALAGLWPLAGFWSKDEILADSWVAGVFDGKLSGYIALALLLVSAFLTAFYMTRQVWMVFFGEPRHEAAKHVPESVWQMTVPLIVLAVFSVFIGFINIPTDSGLAAIGFDFIFGEHLLTDWLEYSVLHAHVGIFRLEIAAIATALGFAAIFLGIRVYGGNRALTPDGRDPLQANAATRPFWSLANARMYWDEAYNLLFIRPFQAIAKFVAEVIDWKFWHDYVHDDVIGKGFNGAAKLLSKPVDQGVVDGSVRGVGRLVKWFSGVLRRSQTGYVRVYAVALLVGVVAVVVLMLLPLVQS